MPTQGDLPDPDAVWRLNGGRGVPPSQRVRVAPGVPRPPGRQRRSALAAEAPPPPPLSLTNIAIDQPNRGGSTWWRIVAVLSGVIVAVALHPPPFYSAATAIVGFMEAGPGFPQSLLYLALAAIPVTLLHEFGHALAARKLLRTPVSVAVGSIGTLAQFELAKISVSLNALGAPARVAGSATFDASRARAFDVLIIALAGPAASAAGLAFSLALLAVSPTAGFVHDMLWAATLGGVFAVLNLVPFAYEERRDGPSVQTDGRLALDAARTLRSLR